MDWALVLILQVMFQPCLSVLLTVEAEQTGYKSEFGGDAVMSCRFQPKLSNSQEDLKVTWHWIGVNSVREVYRMDNGVEHLESQDPDYRGRVMLLTEVLKEGWVKLQVSGLRINDSGTYQCLVQTGEGADYKTIALSVTAPYKAVTKHIQKAAKGDSVLLTCQSAGYPESAVMWQDGQLRQISGNTTVAPTPEQLFNVTSVIRVRSSDKNNYTCSFASDGHSVTFHIPDEIPIAHVKNGSPLAIVSLGVIMVVLIVAVVLYRRQKGSNTASTRSIMVNSWDQSLSAADRLQVNKENEEVMIIFNEGCTEENLGAVMKAHYSNYFFSADVRRHLDAFHAEELPERLQNNESHPVNLQALLPDAGETLFLEGPPESGKTSIAHILVSSWTKGPTHALSNILDLSTVPLLLYVDCSKAKGSLFQEIKTQLSLTSTEDKLRTVLTGSSEALLLLDGYREGNQCLDESLKKFLNERGRCRILVTACPGHCPMLKDTVGSGRVLQLQTNCEGHKCL